MLVVGKHCGVGVETTALMSMIHTLGQLTFPKNLCETTSRVCTRARESCDNLDDSLQGVEEEAENQDDGVEKQDRISYPALRRLCDTKRRYKGHRKENACESNDGEKGMVSIHRCVGLERPKCVEC